MSVRTAVAGIVLGSLLLRGPGFGAQTTFSVRISEWTLLDDAAGRAGSDTRDDAHAYFCQTTQGDQSEPELADLPSRLVLRVFGGGLRITGDVLLKQGDSGSAAEHILEAEGLAVYSTHSQAVNSKRNWIHFVGKTSGPRFGALVRTVMPRADCASSAAPLLVADPSQPGWKEYCRSPEILKAGECDLSVPRVAMVTGAGYHQSIEAEASSYLTIVWSSSSQATIVGTAIVREQDAGFLQSTLKGLSVTTRGDHPVRIGQEQSLAELHFLKVAENSSVLGTVERILSFLRQLP